MPQRNKGDKDKFPLGVLLLIALGYGVIYVLFFFQIGLPAGNELGNKEWLSFLSGYLGFAGTLIMSVMVYRQERQLAQLTLKQNNFRVECTIEMVECGNKNFETRYHNFYIPKFFEENDSKRFYFINRLEKNYPKDEGNKDCKTVILSTALYCSNAATVLNVYVKSISLFRILDEQEPEKVAVYGYSSEPEKNFRSVRKNCILERHNQLLLSFILPNFLIPEIGEYELQFDIHYDTYSKNDDHNTISIWVAIEPDVVKVIDGAENPCVSCQDLLV